MPWPPYSGARRVLLPSRVRSGADLQVDRATRQSVQHKGDVLNGVLLHEAWDSAPTADSSRCRERSGLLSIAGDKRVDLLHARLNG